MLGFSFKKQKFYKRNFDSVDSANCEKSEIFAALMRKFLIRGEIAELAISVVIFQILQLQVCGRYI